MADRKLRESILTSESINQLTWFEEVFFYRLIVSVDVYGTMDARPSVLKAKLFPLKNRLTLRDVERALSQLASKGVVRTYLEDGKPRLCLPTWTIHQNLRTRKSDASGDMSDDENSETYTNMHEHVHVFQEEKSPSLPPIPPILSSKEEIYINNTRERFVPPTVDEVKAYCAKRGNNVDPENFVDFYTAKGWVVGKAKMKDWKAAVRTWERRDNRSATQITDPDKNLEQW